MQTPIPIPDLDLRAQHALAPNPFPPIDPAPTPLRAFHGDAARKEFYLQRVRAHRAADEIVKGNYWNPDEKGVFRGCAVGCTLHSGMHADYETELGISPLLAHLEDSIFEGLPEDRALSWPEEFLSAPSPGADLSLVWPRFAMWLLIDPEQGVLRFAKTDAMKLAIVDVASVYSRVVKGETVSRGVWEQLHASASAAAFAAASFGPPDSAASAAAFASAAAAASFAPFADADAIRVAQADKLLELMRAA